MRLELIRLEEEQQLIAAKRAQDAEDLKERIVEDMLTAKPGQPEVENISPMDDGTVKAPEEDVADLFNGW